MTQVPPAPARPPRRFLVPREHGAYGQFLLPLATALVAAGGAPAAWLVAVGALGVFLAHEPFIVLLGHRGARRAREEGPQARRALAGWLLLAAAAGIPGLLLAGPDTLLAAALPLVPALLLVPVVRRGEEWTMKGELLASLALPAVAAPVARAGGAPWVVALGLAVAWCTGMVLASLAVRIVLENAKRQPHAKLVAAVLAGLFAFGALSIALAATGTVPALAAFSVAPLWVLSALISLRPPDARRLRDAGFAILGASTLTLVGLVLSLRGLEVP